MADFKRTICLDFDGVIHSYEKGWQDGSIYGELTRGFVEWAEEAKKHFKLVIYSSRSSTPEGIDAIIQWLEVRLARHGGNVSILDFEYADKKPAAWLTIDDRCVRFEGRWDWVRPEVLLDFKPWNAA